MILSQKIISTSILASNNNLKKEILDISKSGADWIHIDVMDGKFVKNVTFSPDIIASIRPLTKMIFDTHLMIKKCDYYIQTFAKVGCDIIIIHAEASTNLYKSLNLIKEEGKKSGICLNPDTDENCLLDIIDYVDLILVMTVHPGFCGQKFLYYVLKKIINIKYIINKRPIYLAVDGGITLENISLLAKLEVDVYVIGSTIFKNGNAKKYFERIKSIKNIISKTLEGNN